MRFVLVLLAPEAADVDIDPETMSRFEVLYDAYGRALANAGVLVSADVPQPSPAVTSVTVRDGIVGRSAGPSSTGLFSTAPSSTAPQRLSGTFVIDAADADEAVEWASRCPGALYGVVQVWPSALYFADGQWRAGGA